MIETSDVFTPAKLPTYTDVDRTHVSKDLRRWMRHGGYFVSVLGTTKLGKTTLIKNFLNNLNELSWSVYIPGQTLQKGDVDLWKRLVNDLGIPTSQETGYASSDKSTWKVFTSLAAKIPGLAATLGIEVGGDKQTTDSNGNKYDLHPSQAVTEAITLLRGQGYKIYIAIDDFHFIINETDRRAVALALRPLAEEHSCSVILSTIPGGQLDLALENTNLGGRRKSVEVPIWSEEELTQIATKGFPVLSVSASDETVKLLAKESFGSPQIMQQLCLDLCEEVNDVLEGSPELDETELNNPEDWDAFFHALKDDEAVNWVTRLSAGPNPRKKRKKKYHPGPPAQELDGYQLLMRALHELGSPREVMLSVIKQHIGEKLSINGSELQNLAVELKARNLHLLASKDTKAAIERLPEWEPTLETETETEDETALEEKALADFLAAEAIPQPVFEVKGTQHQAIVRILDPLLCYALKWHPEAIAAARVN